MYSAVDVIQPDTISEDLQRMCKILALTSSTLLFVYVLS